MSYEWIPGQGPSEDAIKRMRLHFPKPSYPLGEAWFMGEKRKYFDELMENPFSVETLPVLKDCLWEIASGTISFGPAPEWHDWFFYLLPDFTQLAPALLQRDRLVQEVVSTFMILQPEAIVEYYDGFAEDVFSPFSQCLMNPHLWSSWTGKHTKLAYQRALFLSDWEFWQADEEMSAMMFFCLKYMPVGEIGSWVDSILSISDPYWRAALVVWLLGANTILTSPDARLSMIEHASSKISWENYFLVESLAFKYSLLQENEFIPSNSRATFMAELKGRLTPERYLEWVEALSLEPDLYTRLSSELDRFFGVVLSPDSLGSQG